jgi:hypothetical protein
MIKEEMRSVLETLARSLTSRDDLSVVWGYMPCTDYDKIYIRSDEDIVPGVDCTPGESWLSKKAIIAHESAHLLFTSEKDWKDFCRSSSSDSPEAHILNIVEDARVERAMANLFPGTLRWLRFSNEYIFVNKTNWATLPPQDQALYELCSYAVVGRIHDDLAEQERKFVQECAPYIDRGRISATTKEAARETEKIVEIYKKYYGKKPTLPEPEISFSLKPVSSPDGELDPRRMSKLAPMEKEPLEQEESDEGTDANPTVEDDSTGDDASEDTDTDYACDDTGDTTKANEVPDDTHADDDCEEELEGDDSNPVSGDTGEASGGDGKDDLLSDIDDLLEKSEEEAKRLSSPDEPTEEPVEVTKEEVAGKFSMVSHERRGFRYETIQGDDLNRAEIEKEIHPSAVRTANEIRKILESRRGGKRKGIPKGYLDRSALWKVAVREPHIFMRKNAPSIHPDLALYLLLDCSGSMRLQVDCHPRLYHAAKAGILLHKVCKMLDIPHASAGFTTENLESDSVVHYKLKEFHDTEANIDSVFNVSLSHNIDGFSIKTAASELLTRPESNKVLFVISDGLPGGVYYGGNAAVNDTAVAVREALSYGIGTIGMFIGNKSGVKKAKRIYQHLIYLEQTAYLPFAIAKTLKTLITSRA